MADALAKPAMTDARKAAFERCRAARAAALARKKQEKEDKAAADRAPPAAPVAEPAADESEPVAAEPVVVHTPSIPLPEPAPVDNGASLHDGLYGTTEDEEIEYVDANEMVDLIKNQSQTLASMREELASMRKAQAETAARAADLSTSFTQHGVKQQYSLNFV
jgi:hypothetical protein